MAIRGTAPDVLSPKDEIDVSPRRSSEIPGDIMSFTTPQRPYVESSPSAHPYGLM
jgi:hypothetical protein